MVVVLCFIIATCLKFHVIDGIMEIVLPENPKGKCLVINLLLYIKCTWVMEQDKSSASQHLTDKNLKVLL